MKLRYPSAGLAIILIGLIVAAEASLLSQVFLKKTVILEIPRKDFRLRVERLWQGDVIQLDFDIQGGEEDLYILIERFHFYIGTRQEFGVPASIFTSTVLGPSLITGSESLTYTADLEGHINIFFNNTVFTQPKTVTFTRIFKKSTNMMYATVIIRNLCLLAGGVLLILGLLENYDDIRYRRKIGG